MNTTDWTDIQQVKEDVWIFDIDGTLADHQGIRGPFEEHKVHLDMPIKPVWLILDVLSARYKIIFLSGRTDGCKQLTITWLQNYMLWQDIELYMRKTGDQRKDSIVKKEIYDRDILPKYNVIGVFDDRDQVCQMWIENNVFLFNVSQGKGNF